MPMEPEPPGWLTTGIFWPRTFSISPARVRQVWSVAPPADQGTIRVIGRSGFHSA